MSVEKGDTATRVLSWRLSASFVLQCPTAPESPDRRRRPATSSASTPGFFLSRWTFFPSAPSVAFLCSPALFLSPSHFFLALLSRGHSVSTRGTPLRAREWRLSRLARPFQRAGAIPSFLPACLLAYLSLPTPQPFLPLSFSFSRAHPNMLACSPRADDWRRACARCHPDCLIVS